MDLIELRERVRQHSDRLGVLAANRDRTADEENEFDRLLAEANDLYPRAEREIAAAQTLARGRDLTQSTGSVTATAAAEAADAGEPPDRRTLGRRFAESPQVQEWLAGPLMPGVGSRPFYAQHPEGDAARPKFRYDGQGPVTKLALISGGGLPSFAAPPQLYPEIVRPRDFPLVMRDVIGAGTTATDTIYFVRETGFTNAAAETAEATSFDPAALGAGGGLKPQSTLTFDEQSVPVRTIANWIPVTRIAIADVGQLQGYVENRLMVGVERRINSQIANGDGVAPNILGILNASGVLNHTDAFFTALTPPLQDATAVNAIFNRIKYSMTAIDVSSNGLATFVAVHPYDYDAMRTASSATREYLGGGPFVAGPIDTLWGIPVVRERSLPQGTALVGDGTAAMWFDRESTNILIGWVNDQFVRNMLTILAEARGALAIFRPQAFAKVDITP